MDTEKNPREMSELEIEQEMKERKNWDSRYFSLQSELEDRDNKE